MKLFIILALASVALATPLVQPVVMPEAPLPEFEVHPYVPMVEPVAIKPLFVPQEVIEALKLAVAQLPTNAQAVFEAMEQTADADVVHVVEHAMPEIDAEQAAAAAAAENIPADAVNFVDTAEDVESEVAEQLDANVEEMPADSVNFVDLAENIEIKNAAPAIEAIEPRNVQVVDYVVYDNEADHVVEKKAAPAAEEIPADAVHFVDVAENINSELADEKVNAEEIIPEAVHFVDNSENMEAVAGNVEELLAVKVVDVAPVADDFSRYPGKIYDNSMLR